MILDSLLASAIFAGIVAILSVPWMLGGESHSERH